MRTPVVVDTNVLCLANGKSSYSQQCENACGRKLVELQHSGTIVIDSKYLILKEYEANQPKNGQPGLGVVFLKWLFTSRNYVQVEITPDEEFGFVEFPNHNELKDFDRSDRKFVAVSVAHGSFPSIIQAADSKWWGWRTALFECGVATEFLCSEEIAAKHTKKIGAAKQFSIDSSARPGST